MTKRDMKKTTGNPCEHCNAHNLHCPNPNSPSYLYYCGEYPGTGPEHKYVEKEAKR